jgi:hypothetical protein
LATVDGACQHSRRSCYPVGWSEKVINLNILQTLKFNAMRFLYLIAVLLIIFWALGFLAFNLGGLIHILLVLAVISILLRLIGGRRV